MPNVAKGRSFTQTMMMFSGGGSSKASSSSHSEVATPLVFNEEDAKSLESALLASPSNNNINIDAGLGDQKSASSPPKPFSPPPYSSVCNSISSSANNNNNKNNKNQQKHETHSQLSTKPPSIDLKSIPLFTTVTDLSSSCSSISSSSSSVSSAFTTSDLDSDTDSNSSGGLDTPATSIGSFNLSTDVSNSSQQQPAASDDGGNGDTKFLSSVLSDTSAILEQPAEPFSADGFWQGEIVSDDSDASRTLFVTANEFDDLRERVLDLLEMADEEYECTGIVICLNKDSGDLANLIHSLLYVGGTVIPPNHPKMVPNNNHVLVGIEL